MRFQERHMVLLGYSNFYGRILPRFLLAALSVISVPALYGQRGDDIPKQFSMDEGFWFLTGGMSHTSNIGGEIGVGAGYVGDIYSIVFSTHVAGAATLEFTGLDGSFAFAPRLSVWTSYPLAMLVVGVGAGYYLNSEKEGWMIQPEIGLNLTVLRVTWRLDLPLGTNSPWEPSHGINMKFHLPITNVN